MDKSERTASAHRRDPAIAMGTCIVSRSYEGQEKTYSSSWMCTCSYEIGVFDTWMPRLWSEREDIEEIMSDSQDGSVGQIELFFPGEWSIDFFP